MVEVVGIQEITGAFSAPIYTDLTSSRYGLSDTALPNTNSPLAIPPDGFNYSYWKHHVLVMSGSFTQINNIRWFTQSIAWSLGTSGSLMVLMMSGGQSGVPVSNGYTQASGAYTTGVWGLSGHTYYANTSGMMGLASQFTSASLLTIDSTTYVDAGAKSKAIVTQVSVDDDALAGNQATAVVGFRYDAI